MLYLFRYLPKQVTLDIFVDISIMYLDIFVCEADLHILMFQIIYCLLLICRKSWTIFVSEVNLTTGDEKLTPYRVRGTKNTLSN